MQSVTTLLECTLTRDSYFQQRNKNDADRPSDSSYSYRKKRNHDHLDEVGLSAGIVETALTKKLRESPKEKRKVVHGDDIPKHSTSGFYNYFIWVF
jgi:hypothetical protein